MLIQRKTDGFQIATSFLTVSANNFITAAEGYPDAAEHDPGKECVLLRRAKITLAAAALVDYYAAVAQSMQLCAIIRSGNFAAVSAMPSVIVLNKWIRRTVGDRSIIAAVTNTVYGGAMQAEFEFVDDPLILNPSTFSWGAYLDSTGAADFNAAANFLIEYEYKWAKAGQKELGAYLGWEALGA